MFFFILLQKSVKMQLPLISWRAESDTSRTVPQRR